MYSIGWTIVKLLWRWCTVAVHYYEILTVEKLMDNSLRKMMRSDFIDAVDRRCLNENIYSAPSTTIRTISTIQHSEEIYD